MAELDSRDDYSGVVESGKKSTKSTRPPQPTGFCEPIGVEPVGVMIVVAEESIICRQGSLLDDRHFAFVRIARWYSQPIAPAECSRVSLLEF